MFIIYKHHVKTNLWQKKKTIIFYYNLIYSYYFINIIVDLHKNSVNPNNSPFVKPVNWVSSKKKWITAIFFLKEILNT